jgi:predicted Zn-dependent protease
MPSTLAERFHAAVPKVDFASLRRVRERSQELSVRDGVVQPPRDQEEEGALITVEHGGGQGYAATSDLSPSGLREAFRRAKDWAQATADRSAVRWELVEKPAPRGRWERRGERGWASVPLTAKLDLLRAAGSPFQGAAHVVDWESSLWFTEVDVQILSTTGADVEEHTDLLVPNLMVALDDGGDTVERSLGGRGFCRQGGLEILDLPLWQDAPARLLREGRELLSAPDCPTGVMDLLLAPDQMMLQIHESIGHPLELDRILGDERNYAGTSFVTKDMFGSYRYGSELLNITFDPSVGGEFASYGWDAEGHAARREFLIRDGLLLRGLGSGVSQARSGLGGVASARSTSWNRAPIDRMANLNLEPGSSSFDDLVRQTERGVYMETNTSWSIDDSRNKFQFGCEFARLIVDGAPGPVVRKPNYRGISATFWRNLKGVGDASTFQVWGTPYCGKGEPNQAIRVGHGSPACLFHQVDVFGGA